MARKPTPRKPRTWRAWALVTHPERELVLVTEIGASQYLIFETRGEAEAMLWGGERIMRVTITEEVSKP